MPDAKSRRSFAGIILLAAVIYLAALAAGVAQVAPAGSPPSDPTIAPPAPPAPKTVPPAFIPLFSVLFIPTLLTLYAKADVAPRLGAWSGSILALIALNFTLTVRYPALDSHSLVAQAVAIGLCYQLMMVFLTMTALNPPIAQQVVSKDIGV